MSIQKNIYKYCKHYNECLTMKLADWLLLVMPLYFVVLSFIPGSI